MTDAVPTNHVIDANDTVDIGNYRLVASRGNNIVILNPPAHPMTSTDALVFAAWLVALAEGDAPTGITFDGILERVRNT